MTIAILRTSVRHQSRYYPTISTSAFKPSRRFITNDATGTDAIDRHRKMTLSLYRCLLRTSKSFSFSPHGKILSSLLHRTGIEETFHRVPYSSFNTNLPTDKAGREQSKNDNTQIKLDPYDKDSLEQHFFQKSNRVPLNYHEAQDLTRGYIELQRIHYLRKQVESNFLPLEHASQHDPLKQVQQNANVLFRTLLKEALSHISTNPTTTPLKQNSNSGTHPYIDTISPLMRFPCQIGTSPTPEYSTISALINDADVQPGNNIHQDSHSEASNNRNPTLWDIIRREFRAEHVQNENLILPSRCFSYDTRLQVAFMAMKELNQKLTYAHSLGYDTRTINKAHHDILTTTLNDTDHQSTNNASLNSNTKDPKTNTDTPINHLNVNTKRRNRTQAAKGVSPLSYDEPSAYLQPGTFLIAHPLLSGYFSNSVICILDHSDGKDEESDNENIDDDDVENLSKSRRKGQDKSTGGTYGLVINRHAIRRRPQTFKTSSIRTSPTTATSTTLLKEVLRADSLPEGFRTAFGDCVVREGGPVNLSVQMMHTCSPDLEERLQIGGRVLSPALAPNPSSDVNDNNRSRRDGQISALHEINTPAMNSDHAVFFQGDIIKAAQAVIDGDLKKMDFSFVVGASCWESGQLESEIKRGYWLPASGPMEIAFGGKCHHEDYPYSKSNEEKNDEYQYKPVDNLWLSMMCAMGDEEGDLAHLMLEDDYDELGEVCDDF